MKRLVPLAVVMALSVPAAADIDARRLVRVTAAARATSPSALVDAPLSDGDERLPVLVSLPAGQSAASLGLLEVAPRLGAARLTAAELAAFGARHPALVPAITPPRHTLLNVSNKWTGDRAFREETGFDGSGVVVGIIDTGLDVTHADFLDASGNSRVAWLMMRDTPRGLHPELEQAYGCTSPDQSPCAIFSAADIDALLATDPAAAPVDVDGHGTHVASIAAGNGGISLLDNPPYEGVAPGATVIIASPSPSGGFRDPDILRAAQFIFERAAAMGMPAVVNLSLGSDFGPHDGSSALERGLAAMVGEDHPGRAIVVAAGNSGSLYRIEDQGPFGVHTEAHVSPGATKRVPMRTAGGSGRVEGAGFVWVTFRPGDQVSVGLEGPGGDGLIGLVPPGDERGHEGDDLSAGIINNLINDKSSLTEQTTGAVVFFDGAWDAEETFAVLLRGDGDAQLWVTGTGGATIGSAGLGLLFDKALKAGTVAVPASHPELLAVGCTLNRVQWRSFLSPAFVLSLPSFGGVENPEPDSICYFSGAGPTPSGHPKPDLVAPGAFVAGAMSRDADPRENPLSIFSAPHICPDPEEPCLLVDDRHALTSGTSMSAPYAAGAAALLLQLDPTLTQPRLREILQAGVRHPVGAVPFDYQMGAGALDLRGALQVVEDRLLGEGVDLGASYYVLSSPYARPDPSWPVHGTVELRHADGTVVMDEPASSLSVVLDGGVLTKPVEKVRAGLYRFALSAPPGSGGDELRVEVRYRGASLGVRELPIGVDAWAAEGGVRPVGGCQTGRAREEGWSWLALVLLGTLSRGRGWDSTRRLRRRIDRPR